MPIQNMQKGLKRMDELFDTMMKERWRAPRPVAKAVADAYKKYMDGSEYINNFGQPQRTGSPSIRDQALTARAHIQKAHNLLGDAVSKDLRR